MSRLDGSVPVIVVGDATSVTGMVRVTWGDDKIGSNGIEVEDNPRLGDELVVTICDVFVVIAGPGCNNVLPISVETDVAVSTRVVEELASTDSNVVVVIAVGETACKGEVSVPDMIVEASPRLVKELIKPVCDVAVVEMLACINETAIFGEVNVAASLVLVLVSELVSTISGMIVVLTVGSTVSRDKKGESGKRVEANP